LFTTGKGTFQKDNARWGYKHLGFKKSRPHLLKGLDPAVSYGDYKEGKMRIKVKYWIIQESPKQKLRSNFNIKELNFFSRC